MYKQSWSELHNTDSRQTSENVMMQTSTNMPTKRFSFLIRSNSVKQETPSATEHQPVTPSDQAILDKLATLSLQAPEVVVKPQVKCSLFTPPCARCAESVYPQERVEPTLRLVYHSACFKCYHCGVRLTLKTFFRSPLDSKDSRVFCKSHVPALDPGRVSVPGSCSSHASRTLPRVGDAFMFALNIPTLFTFSAIINRGSFVHPRNTVYVSSSLIKLKRRLNSLLYYW